MKFKLIFLFSVIFIPTFILNAQELRIFDLQLHGEDVFVSLSDAYDLGEKIAETDKVFIYDFSLNVLKTFRVKDLKFGSYPDGYGGGGIMTGFRLNKKTLKGFDKNFIYAFVYVGKKNPFVQKRLVKVVWNEIEPEKFPLAAIELKDTQYYKESEYDIGRAYKFETKYYRYYMQDLVIGNEIFAKRLMVVDTKTDDKIYETIYNSSESATLAPLDNQWTGKLFKNKPAVIFGFQYHSFGCPSIQFLSPSINEIYIYCDNNH